MMKLYDLDLYLEKPIKSHDGGSKRRVSEAVILVSHLERQSATR